MEVRGGRRGIDQGLAYGDVLLVPRYSEVLPADCDVSTRLTRGISLNIPIVSAAMDTVTECKAAIAMARQGGMGFIHKNMSVKAQADHVRRVKKSTSFMIMDPVTISPNGTVSETIRKMEDYQISGIPVVDARDQLLGIVTNRDLRGQSEYPDRPVSEVMTSEGLISLPDERRPDRQEIKRILDANKIEKLLVIDSQGRLKGMTTYRDIQKGMEFPRACKDSEGRLRVGAALGGGEECLTRVEALVNAGVDVVVLDSAHAHSRNIINALEDIKGHYPDLEVIAGNIVTAEAVRDLAKAGADAVKVGIGAGSICTTRMVAGIGVPQMTAVFTCAEACRVLDLPLIADGGIRYSGDITKALAGGAQSVMLGSMLAGTDESPGEIITVEGRRYKEYRGMGSLDAMKEHEGSRKRYNQSEDANGKLVPEGIVGRLPVKGSIAEELHQLVGGLRSGMGYIGAATIRQLQEKALFRRITPAGYEESRPHSVEIMKEAPNYRG
jgi:IMP dehydrogenase